ncbi:hypothetical protein RRG08_015224 [Elysia crispata]|uniref:Uncharacterized protein n=1 Tax=Elysia crispata TaxID=231223 RepID=A0AAE1A7F0_9GAST|nr:hypothetical protein RRG08_015224 [Elysia crispata]
MGVLAGPAAMFNPREMFFTLTILRRPLAMGGRRLDKTPTITKRRPAHLGRAELGQAVVEDVNQKYWVMLFRLRSRGKQHLVVGKRMRLRDVWVPRLRHVMRMVARLFLSSAASASGKMTIFPL